MDNGVVIFLVLDGVPGGNIASKVCQKCGVTCGVHVTAGPGKDLRGTGVVFMLRVTHPPPHE